ncbi:hypothetical protein WG922_05800 [Ramlibacter sp. AN1015]|uniref:hypothetical protein n=1 Tax=Ramlibacter sp. AN1015 TaxID=3133428 RepID=UPI0030BAA166
MSTHPDEFGGTAQRLLESAIESSEAQLAEAERLVKERFRNVSGDTRAQLVVAMAHVIAANFVAAATIRNLPKG